MHPVKLGISRVEAEIIIRLKSNDYKIMRVLSMTKKFFLSLICLCLAINAVAQDGSDRYDGYIVYYTVTDRVLKEACLTGYAFYGYSDSVLVIPSTTQSGFKITSIAARALRGYTNFTSILIPKTVTSIGNSAFAYCSGLTSINIPESVTTIEGYAFQECKGLTSVTIPESVTSIFHGAFDNCTGLSTVNFNATNCTMMGQNGYSVFKGCTNITSLNIGKNVTKIPDYSFMGCSGFPSVVVPNNVEFIGRGAFSGCSGLVEISLPTAHFSEVSADKLIGRYPFGYIFGTQSYKGGTAVLQTYESFYIPSNLERVSITNSDSLVNNAFQYCSMLTSVSIMSADSKEGHLDIGNSVTLIGDNIFRGCTGLKSATQLLRSDLVHFKAVPD